MEFSGLNNIAELKKLVRDSQDLVYLNSSALKRLYSDVTHTLHVIQAILNAPNLCERCVLRVKDTWYCDMASTEIMHRADCISFEPVA